MVKSEIKLGTVVHLNSGSPKMTVTSISDAGNLRCHFISSNAGVYTIHEIYVPKEAVEKPSF